MRSDLVPDIIPRIPIMHNSEFNPATRGKEVLPRTPDIWLSALVLGLFKYRTEYAYVGARVADERISKIKTKWIHGKPVLEEIKSSDVRFTFCHRQHLNNGPLHPDFLARYDDLMIALGRMTRNNLWETFGHLNPYLENDKQTDHSILMLNCAGRKEAIKSNGTPVMVYQGGRDELGRGVGPRVRLTSFAHQLVLADNKVNFLVSSYA